MKYFVLHTFNDKYTDEHFLKGKSYEHIEERIQKYADGMLSTNKWTLITSNLSRGYLREIDLAEYPEVKKRDFAIIDENLSFSGSEINPDK
jgi:hypothetical protein